MNRTLLSVVLGSGVASAALPDALPLGAPVPGAHSSAPDYPMIQLAPGTFTMGAGADAHTVQLTRPFLLGRHELTIGEFQAVTGRLPPDAVATDDADLPVTGLTVVELQELCNTWSNLARLTPAYAPDHNGWPAPSMRRVPGANGYRLPTEAEWEWAASGGAAAGWTRETSGGVLHPVGTAGADPRGFVDLLGNAWELTSDRPGPYGGNATDPTGATHGYFRVVRGGSAFLPAAEATPTARGWVSDETTDTSVGLRLARDAAP